MSKNLISTPPTMSRQQLRKHFRQCRNELSASDKRTANQNITQKLTQFISKNPGVQTVAAYLSNDGEPDLSAFIEAMWAANIRVALPVLHPVVAGHLLFLNYTSQSKMHQNQFAIAEPKLACQQIIPIAKIDLICMPLVAFDSQGNRLGMGGGFYDRTLAGCHRNAYPNLQLMGIAHDCQQATQLPTEKWDIPLAHVITPSKHWQFSTHSAFSTDSSAD